MSLWSMPYIPEELSIRQSPPPESQAVLVRPYQDCLDIDEHLYIDIPLPELVTTQLSREYRSFAC